MSTADHAEHGNSFYIKTYFILLGLLVVSVVGPELGIKSVTLFTAFGVALIKAYLVAVRFMHINLTPRFVIYAITTTLVFMLLFFAGAAPDVMKDSGTNWEKPAWIAAEADYALNGAPDTHHGAGHGDDSDAGHGEADSGGDHAEDAGHH